MIPFCFGLIFAMVFAFFVLLLSIFGVDLFVSGVVFSFIIGVIVGIIVVYWVWDE